MMSQADYARRIGVTRQRVSQLVAAGVVILVDHPDKPGKKLVNVDASDARLSQAIDSFAGRPQVGEQPKKRVAKGARKQAETVKSGPKGRRPENVKPAQLLNTSDGSGSGFNLDGLNFNELRKKLLIEQVASLKLKNEEAAGRLVPKIEYERRASEYGRRVRSMVNSVVRDHAEKIRPDNPAIVTDTLLTAFEAELSEMADQIEADDGDQISRSHEGEEGA